MLSQTALKYDLEVKENGQVQFQVPFPRGSRLVVFVLEADLSRETDDLLAAAQSSLDFWDNPIDDEVAIIEGQTLHLARVEAFLSLRGALAGDETFDRALETLEHGWNSWTLPASA